MEIRVQAWLSSITLICISACAQRLDQPPAATVLAQTTGVQATASSNSSEASPTKTSAPPTPIQATPTNTTLPATSTAVVPTQESVEAVKYIISSDKSVVSYGVGETFLNQDNRYNYAVGTTSIVSGEIALVADNPSLSKVGPITVDISTFQSDKTRRDKAIRSDWLESSKYPIAVFLPSELRNLPQSYTYSELLTFEILGSLRVREVSSETIFTITARLDGELLIGSATTQVKMSDFGFTAPSIAGILEAENEVDLTFEFTAVPELP